MPLELRCLSLESVAPIVHDGQVASEVLSASMSAQLGPTWRQQRVWLFLRGLTIVFLCCLLHGSESSGFITAVSHRPGCVSNDYSRCIVYCRSLLGWFEAISIP